MELPALGFSSNAIGGWPRDLTPVTRFATMSPMVSRSLVMFATVCGLSDTRSTISFLDTVPCRRITSRTMRRFYGALDCWVVPRLTNIRLYTSSVFILCDEEALR